MAKRRILFIDRDGTLINEPDDEQVDSLEELKLLPDVIPALLALRDAGYAFVMVSNQDGLGTDAYPEEHFELVQGKLLELFQSQGIRFEAVHIDRHFEDDNAHTRKPGIGMVIDYLKSGDLDLDDSWVIGDRESDLEMARNMGIGGLRIGDGFEDWNGIRHHLVNRPRQAEVRRKTKETDVRVFVDLDAGTKTDIGTGIGFFDHMLEQLARHGAFMLELSCAGDLEIDEHHTVEDCALALGEALGKALKDRRGIGRYGFTLPMDESLAEVAVDLSGRPAFVFNATFPLDRVGGLSTEMVRHFFASLSQSLGASIHMKVSGENTHHMIEALFKGAGRALRPALARDGSDIPSTKGSLT